MTIVETWMISSYSSVVVSITCNSDVHVRGHVKGWKGQSRQVETLVKLFIGSRTCLNILTLQDAPSTCWKHSYVTPFHTRSVAHIVDGAGGSFKPKGKGPVSSPTREGFVLKLFVSARTTRRLSCSCVMPEGQVPLDVIAACYVCWPAWVYSSHVCRNECIYGNSAQPYQETL